MLARHQKQQLPLFHGCGLVNEMMQGQIHFLVGGVGGNISEQLRKQERQIIGQGIKPQNPEPFRTLKQIRGTDALFPVLDGLL